MPSQDSVTVLSPPSTTRTISASSLSKDRRRSSFQPKSPTTPPSAAHKALHQKSHSKTHLVGHGHGRAHQPRIPSYGKNLNRLTKANQPHDEDGGPAAVRDARRSKSHAVSTSPRSPKTKRIGSNVSLAKIRSDLSLGKNTSQVSLQKNTSKTSLKRNSSLKDLGMTRLEKGGPARMPTRPDPSRKGRKPSVHFDLGHDDPDQEESWTEVSNSESPEHTRADVSVNGDIEGENGGTAARPTEEHTTVPEQAPLSSENQPIPTQEPRPEMPSHADRSTGPDLRAITSKLLLRHPPHNAPPQMSSVSATVTPVSRSPRSLPRSQSSAVATGTPGNKADVISRFVGESTNGTPNDHSVSPVIARRGFPTATEDGDGTPKKSLSARKSHPDLKVDSSPGPLSAPVPKGADSPSIPSRTQQKLWLQRASSAIEPAESRPDPHHHLSDGFPTPGGLRAARGGMMMSGPTSRRGGGDGIDPAVQKQFERATLEYRIVRRYRNPIADAISRLNKLPGGPKPKIGLGTPSNPITRRLPISLTKPPQASPLGRSRDEARMGLSQSLKESSRLVDRDGARRGKDDNDLSRRDVRSRDGEGEPDAGQEPVVEENPIGQILRRMWDHVEPSGGE
ncbi:MAG: hypothetical protein M1817_003208 [Caeruleum heppii]|nr:MAG: hypothetical protein M1817_003208 [Caeruleum heppii]